ncbi:putative membrane spanning protein [Roseomonas mucosa]|uniref:SH3 domain-containing protein n=1 Tax=Roseomonas TaxID=125216 RepID=UPI0009FD7115|nr:MULTISPECIES: SH3 domain-containing protein [Roseomonas]ATR22596.1 hypothetical protein CTJ15_21305 [Roseomonas sp. FDAARGOS_362]USQ72711.1 SH3 domain-containing protein [Roseomonas mucosa]UZO98660.1 putative membrane spanning protein [Roseomonas mucosa]
MPTRVHAVTSREQQTVKHRITAHTMALGLGLGLALGVVAPASAAPGYATGDVNLRAGPGTAYPRVAMIGAGAPLEIFGCLDGYNWCDVGAGGMRGWVSGSYLQYAYQGRRVLIPEYGPRIGVPIVTFDFGDYWGRYYRGRPWYSPHDRWGGPPPPPYRPGPPPGPPPGWYGHPGGGPGGAGWERPGHPPGPGYGPGPGAGPGGGPGPRPGRPPGPEWERHGPGGPDGERRGPGGPPPY